MLYDHLNFLKILPSKWGLLDQERICFSREQFQIMQFCDFYNDINRYSLLFTAYHAFFMRVAHTFSMWVFSGNTYKQISCTFSTGEKIQTLCLQLAVRQCTSSPTAALFLSSWITPPLYNTLTVSTISHLHFMIASSFIINLQS